MTIKIIQLTSFGGNSEDFLPWYSRYFIVSGEGLNFDEPIFATIEANAESETYFDHANDVLDALRAAGYTIQDVDTPISFAADDWGDHM